MASYNVHVSNIAPATTQKSLEDFFTFCGKISSIDFHESATPKSAVIHFEKPTAVKTALMLNGGTLDGEHLTVSSETEHPDEPNEPYTAGAPINQTDKPRAAIAAEYLAKGYVLSDQILQRAIELDQKQGISSRFLGYWNSFDHAVGNRLIGNDATLSAVVVDAVTGADQAVGQRLGGQSLSGVVQGHVNTALGTAKGTAKSVDEQHGITSKSTDYYQKAVTTPYGQRVRQFYTTTSKQMLDIHEEAKRISGAQSGTVATAPTTGAPATTAAPATTTAPSTGVAPATTVPIDAATTAPVHTETAPTVV